MSQDLISVQAQRHNCVTLAALSPYSFVFRHKSFSRKQFALFPLSTERLLLTAEQHTSND